MARYFVKFPEPALRMAARPMLDADPERFEPFFPMGAGDAEHVLIADLSDQERKAAEDSGATVYEDVQFYPTGPANPFEFRKGDFAYWDPSPAQAAAVAARLTGPAAAPAPAPWQTKTLDDVLQHITRRPPGSGRPARASPSASSIRASPP
jgi:hypothetical protein